MTTERIKEIQNKTATPKVQVYNKPYYKFGMK